MQIHPDGLEREKQLTVHKRKTEILNNVEAFNGTPITLGDLEEISLDTSLLLVPIQVEREVKKPEKYIKKIYRSESGNRFLILGEAFDLTLIDIEPENNELLTETIYNLDYNLLTPKQIFYLEDEIGQIHNLMYLENERNNDSQKNLIEIKKL